MFAPRTAMYLNNVSQKKETNSKGERQKLIVLTFTIQPFTPDQAADLNVKSRLFDASSGDPFDDVLGSKLAVSAGGKQKVLLYRAPEPEMPVSVELRYATFDGGISVRADKETPQYAATFSLVADKPSADDLLKIWDGCYEQWFATFELEQPSILETEEQAEARKPMMRGKKSKTRDQGGEQPTLEVTDPVTVQ